MSFDYRKPIPIWMPIVVIVFCLVFLAVVSISGGVISW